MTTHTDQPGFFVPPQPGTEADLTATTVVTAATGVGEASDRWLTIASSSAFNIAFSAEASSDGSNITDPANTSVFPAGLYSFSLTRKNTHFKLTPAANGKLKYWKSSRT